MSKNDDLVRRLRERDADWQKQCDGWFSNPDFASTETEVAVRRTLYCEAADEIERGAAQGQDWRDISSAPKDGTWFVARQDGETYPCQWHEEEPDEGPGNQGWYDLFNRSFEAPTEWCPASPAPAPDAGEEYWRDEIDAPKDGTMVKLLVAPSRESWTPFDDSIEPYETIGFNNLANTEEDRWEFVGWDWNHDCFVTGHGEVIGWAPFAPSPTPQPPAVEAEAGIKRWNCEGDLAIEDDDGKWVRFTDHEAALKAKTDEIERLTNLVDRIRNEAIGHSMEARGANATVNECYRAVTEGKGEPGNWHGAEPVKAEIERLRRERDEARESVRKTREWLAEAQSRAGEQRGRAMAAEASNKALREGLKGTLDAWEMLPEGYHRIHAIQSWLADNMQPAIARARALLSEKGGVDG